MDVLSLLVPNSEPPVVAEPRQGPFDHPAVASQLLAGVDPLAGDPLTGDANFDPALHQGHSASRNVVGLVGVKLPRALPGPASRPLNRSDSVDQFLEDSRAQGVCSGNTKRQRNPSAVDHNMAFGKMTFGSWFSAIYRVRATREVPLFPTPTAGIDCESTDARVQSIWSVRPKRPRKAWWSRSQTPASCQSRRRRQQVMPQPQPISCGSISHGMPLLSTNRIPEGRTVGNAGPPALRLRRGNAFSDGT